MNATPLTSAWALSHHAYFLDTEKESPISGILEKLDILRLTRKGLRSRCIDWPKGVSLLGTGATIERTAEVDCLISVREALWQFAVAQFEGNVQSAWITTGGRLVLHELGVCIGWYSAKHLFGRFHSQDDVEGWCIRLRAKGDIAEYPKESLVALNATADRLPMRYVEFRDEGPPNSGSLSAGARTGQEKCVSFMRSWIEDRIK